MAMARKNKEVIHAFARGAEPCRTKNLTYMVGANGARLLVSYRLLIARIDPAQPNWPIEYRTGQMPSITTAKHRNLALRILTTYYPFNPLVELKDE